MTWPEPEMRCETAGCPRYFTAPEPLMCTSRVRSALTATLPDPLMRTTTFWAATSANCPLAEPLTLKSSASTCPAMVSLPEPDIYDCQGAGRQAFDRQRSGPTQTQLQLVSLEWAGL